MNGSAKIIFLIVMLYSQIILFMNCSGKTEDKEHQQETVSSISESERRIRNLVMNIYGLDSTGHLLGKGELIEGAIDTLVKIGKPAIPFLIEAMKKEDGGACGTAVSVLSKMGEPGFKTLLEAADNKWRPLTETIIELGKFDDERAIPILKDVLRDTSVSFDSRAEAGVALARLGDTIAVTVLLEMLENKESPYYKVARDNVIIALGKIGDKRATEKLIEILKHDKDSFVRRVTADALGLIGGKSAVGVLENMLTDEDRYVRAAVAWALKQITGKDYEYQNPIGSYEPFFLTNVSTY